MDFLFQGLKFAVFAVEKLKQIFPLDEKVSVKDEIRHNAKQAANPYSDEVKGACLEECPETSEAGERREEEEETTGELVEDAFRVTTRARLTYELYSYSKNAMLIMISRSDASRWTTSIDHLKRTFQGYRFEVDICEWLDGSDLYEKCEQFFIRDFTDFGAVGLIVLTSMTSTYDLNPLNNRISLAAMAENFKLDYNPTLATKPKIYMTVTDGRYYSMKKVLDRATYGDVVGFHVPLTLNYLNKLTSNRPDTPMDVLCLKMAAMADDNNFASVIDETVKASTLNYPNLHIVPIHGMNTLSKELYLARVEENQ